MDETNQENNAQIKSREQKLDILMEQIDQHSIELKKTRNDIAQIKEEIAKLSISNSNKEDNDSDQQELKPKYKKILKIIDIIAFIIILFVIIDGVFNGFSWLYALSNFITGLF